MSKNSDAAAVDAAEAAADAAAIDTIEADIRVATATAEAAKAAKEAEEAAAASAEAQKAYAAALAKPVPKARPLPEYSNDGRPVPPPIVEVVDQNAPIGRIAALSNYAAKFVDRIREDIAEIESDTDLSESGKNKKIAKAVVAAVDKYKNLLAEAIAETSKERKKLDDKIKKNLVDRSIDPGDHAEIRAWLRSLTDEQRHNVLREASTGRIAGGSDIIGAVFSAFPSLSGFADDDQALKLARHEHLIRAFPIETQKLAQLDEIEDLAAKAFVFVARSLDQNAPRGAVTAERQSRTAFGKAKTPAEKSKAITEALSAGKTVADILAGN